MWPPPQRTAQNARKDSNHAQRVFPAQSGLGGPRVCFRGASMCERSRGGSAVLLGLVRRGSSGSRPSDRTMRWCIVGATAVAGDVSGVGVFGGGPRPALSHISSAALGQKLAGPRAWRGYRLESGGRPVEGAGPGAGPRSGRPEMRWMGAPVSGPSPAPIPAAKPIFSA